MTTTQTEPAAAPALLCDVCGWTPEMVCPECAVGCGCATSCTGYRHAEWYLNGDGPDDEIEYDDDDEYDDQGAAAVAPAEPDQYDPLDDPLDDAVPAREEPDDEPLDDDQLDHDHAPDPDSIVYSQEPPF